MKRLQKRTRIILAAVAVLILVIAAYFFWIWKDNQKLYKMADPTQSEVDERSALLMNYLNDPEKIPDTVQSDNGRFRVAEGSPTVDNARYLFAAALPMEGCQYVNWSATSAGEIVTVADTGDQLSGMPTDAEAQHKTGMDRIAFVDVTSHISCKDKNNDELPTVKIRYGLMVDMGTWGVFSRIYSVQYQ